MTGDFAFACACPCQQCTRFLTRIATRPFVGRIAGTLRFLHLEHVNNAHPFFAAANFTEDYSIERDRFGLLSRVGTFGPGPSADIDAIPAAMVSAVGSYELRSIDFAPFTIASFTPGEVYQINTHIEQTFGGGTVVEDRVYSDWLSEDRMDLILKADLADPRPSFINLNPITPLPGDGSLAPRYNPPISDGSGGYLPDVHSLGGWQEACNEHHSEFAPAGAHSWRDVDRFNPRLTDGSSLMQTIIYVGGDHNVTEHVILLPSFLPGAQTSCREFHVKPFYTIAPPEINKRLGYWHEGGRC